MSSLVGGRDAVDSPCLCAEGGHGGFQFLGACGDVALKLFDVTVDRRSG